MKKEAPKLVLIKGGKKDPKFNVSKELIFILFLAALAVFTINAMLGI